MKLSSHAEAFDLLCLLAADEGRGPVLFGDSLDRMRRVLPPFMVGKLSPNVYLEFPLAGEPFLDANVLYGDLDETDRVESEYAVGTERLFEWYARTRRDYPDIGFGYSLDTSKPDLSAAGVYFQQRGQNDLVTPFCQMAGEPERAALYLELAERMPRGWPLSYLGMFRGRPEFPMRAAGYLGNDEPLNDLDSPDVLVESFRKMGFASYDGQMISQMSELLKAAPGTVDFQLDLNPDGTLGDTLSLEVKFDIARVQSVRSAFEDGAAARVMSLLEGWGVADERWKLGVEATFARAIPVERPDGTMGRYAFLFMPQWVKVRWRGAELQPAKFYHIANAGPITG